MTPRNKIRSSQNMLGNFVMDATKNLEILKTEREQNKDITVLDVSLVPVILLDKLTEHETKSFRKKFCNSFAIYCEYGNCSIYLH